MIKTGRALLGSLAALLMTTSLASADEGAADRLADALSRYSTFQAAFTQVVADEQGRVMQETTGNLKARRPGLFYWETDPPANQFIVSDGETVELYDPDLEQVTIQKLDEQVSITPALLLSGETEGLAETYDITEQRYGENTREYTLLPRSEDSLFISLTLTFYDGELQAMRLEDSLAQRTELEFGNVRINEQVPDGAFELDYPESVDVIQGIQ
ncbi:outer membrane lipoprotein chaperone LolA [Marinobacter bryozoorum]|jgi:outer membrane lipoprotein carrier protein|uniref:outer membrane lipoprotein chaperone LolA n=1 Tax=Marinobacter bryozoorum TaxID=256324 RepID=UPI002003BE2C|nr:outer membrane lipoprotein chaperone LolA [Marinobacter bryozoorum]MCK7544676.1 outer membrane lipoprotein chaperone LolA [Marinobacter bryozoorum]